MRLFLLPISTRRTLVYCQRLEASADATSYLEKARVKAASLWASWEQKEKGWQRKVVDYGNQALKRIPYEEWGLKSIPALSTKRKNDEESGRDKVQVSFPANLIPEEKVLDILKKLSTERQGLHKKNMIWSVVGMPLVAPFALVPIIPNLPFFYLVFRAWSHYAALSGSKHLEFLVGKDLIHPQPSKILDKLYAGGKRPFENAGLESPTTGERMVLQSSDHQRFADALEFPELSIELNRAVWQVESALKAEKELEEEKRDLGSAKRKKSEKKSPK